MHYQSDLSFLLDVFEKRGIAVSVAEADTCISKLVDYGADQLLGLVEFRETKLAEYICELSENTLYKLKVKLGIEYMYLLLPKSEGKILMIGPYSEKQHTSQSALELAERQRIDPKYHKLFQKSHEEHPTKNLCLHRKQSLQQLHNLQTHFLLSPIREHPWSRDLKQNGYLPIRSKSKTKPAEPPNIPIQLFSFLSPFLIKIITNIHIFAFDR